MYRVAVHAPAHLALTFFPSPSDVAAMDRASTAATR
jgi:hypothetical protein